MNWSRLNEPPSTSATVLIGQGLGQPGHALEEDVAAGQQGDEQALEHPLLADDDALDLEERALERRVGLACRVLLLAFDRPQAEVFRAHVAA